MRTAGATFYLAWVLAAASEAQSPPFPAGTTQFSDTGASSVVAAPDGGVWVATATGIVRYTDVGPRAVLSLPGRVARIALAADDSIWFTRSDGTPGAPAKFIGRISTTGTILEQYSVETVAAIAVATDGALWYTAGDVALGRISGGVVTERRPAPVNGWSLAPAPGGDMWVLPHGFGVYPDYLHLVTPTGTVSRTVRLASDVLFGEVQSLPNGVVYVNGGIHPGFERLRPGAETTEVIADFPDGDFFVEADGDVWSGDYGQIAFTGLASGRPRFALGMPYDTRGPAGCYKPSYVFDPLAVDSAGAVWIRIWRDWPWIPFPTPCNPPQPPPYPDLLRIDAATFLASHAPADVPALSPAMLVALALVLAATGVWPMIRR